MPDIATPMTFTREHVETVLADNGFGTLVGIRALVVEEMDSSGREFWCHAGWFVAGTIGYVELDPHGSAYLAGVWRPVESYGF